MEKGRAVAGALAALTCAGALVSCAAAPVEPVAPENHPEQVHGLDFSGLKDAAKQIESDTGTQVGIAVYDGTTDATAGSVGVMPAWSTIKVPIAVVAQEHCEYDEETLAELTRSTIEWSDNDSATSLWNCIGADAEASGLVGEEISKGGMSVQVEPAFGTTRWPVPAQARYAHHLASLPADNPVIAEMHKIDSEQSYGLGTIEGVPFKGGWSDADDGSWHSRQLGFTVVDGKAYGIAIAARSLDGSEEDCQKALDEIAAFLETVLDTATEREATEQSE